MQDPARGGPLYSHTKFIAGKCHAVLVINSQDIEAQNNPVRRSSAWSCESCNAPFTVAATKENSAKCRRFSLQVSENCLCRLLHTTYQKLEWMRYQFQGYTPCETKMQCLILHDISKRLDSRSSRDAALLPSVCCQGERQPDQQNSSQFLLDWWTGRQGPVSWTTC